MTRLLDRRQALAGLAGAIAWPTAAFAQTGGAADPAALRFGAVRVDISPLLAHGGGGAARALPPVLEAKLREVFADRLAIGDRRAPVLTARITNLYFSDYVGRSGSSFAFGNNDNIEGDGIVTLGGQVLSSTHILTELPPSYSGSYILPGIDAARLDAIAYQFAYWLRREMGP